MEKSLQEGGRRLIVFAPSVKSPNYEMQMQVLDAEREAFAARAVQLIVVLYKGKSQAGDEALDEAEAARLRQQFSIDSEDFLVVLLGPDGTERARYDAPVQAEVILARLD